jgi:chain length determinant protein (polysaccharide antigen chain regulator)
MDRIAQLAEALEIAKAVGVNDSQINQAANELNMDYMRGIKAIEREIQVLTTRKSDDPFIEEIHDLKQVYAYLAGININTAAIKVVSIDQAAFVPQGPIKPKKWLVIAIAIVLGGMLGIFTAFIRHAIKKRKEALAGISEVK